MTEEFYGHVADHRSFDGYSDAERLAIEYAERFALHHTDIDAAFFARLRAWFTDAEVLDLTICLAHFLGQGRLLRVLGIDETCELDIQRPQEATDHVL